MSENIIFQYSPWYLILCLLTGLGYAFLLYSAKSPWSKNINYLLASVRALLVAFIGALLIGIIFSSTITEGEAPIFALAVDNSESVGFSMDSVSKELFSSKLKSITNQLENNGFNTKLYSLDTSFQSYNYEAPLSNLYGLLKDIQKDNEGKNLVYSALISDGIYNTNASPQYASIGTPIFTVGLGDTIPKSDIAINSALFNKTVYTGNLFPVNVSVRVVGDYNQPVNVWIENNGKRIASKTIAIAGGSKQYKVGFILNAENNGKQEYIIKVSALENELTLENNTYPIYIDVVDTKKNILMVYGAPHPDIKTWRHFIENNQQYDFHLAGPYENIADKKWDLVIFGGYPGYGNRNLKFDALIDSNAAKLFLIFNNTDFRFLKSKQFPIVSSNKRMTDLVSASLNNNFTLFKISNEVSNVLGSFPPMQVPYGTFLYDESFETLLSQKVGSLLTDKPLLVFSNHKERRLGYLLGEGIWRWRLDEFEQNQNNIAVEELILKTIQYLCSEDDKRQFRCFPQNQRFTQGKQVLLETEQYNSLFERVYGNPVSIELSGNNGFKENYSFTPMAGSTALKVHNLPTGVYKYKAQSQINDKVYIEEGSFVVEAYNIELTELTADHILLRKIANASGGNFYSIDQLDKLAQDLIALNPPSVLHSTESLMDLIAFKLTLALLLLLVSIEWFLRKYHGSY